MYRFTAIAFLMLVTGLCYENPCLKPATIWDGFDEYKLNTGKGSRAQPVYHVSGKVTRSFSYCGGANPPKEVLKNLTMPVPYPNKKFHVRKGKINSLDAGIVKSFISDSLGLFSFDVPPGTYAIILDEQLEALRVNRWERPTLQIDEKCLKEWWKKPYMIVEVKNHEQVLPDFHFQQQCFIDFDIPCIMYTGPSPQ